MPVILTEVQAPRRAADNRKKLPVKDKEVDGASMSTKVIPNLPVNMTPVSVTSGKQATFSHHFCAFTHLIKTHQVRFASGTDASPQPAVGKRSHTVVTAKDADERNTETGLTAELDDSTEESPPKKQCLDPLGTGFPFFFLNLQ